MKKSANLLLSLVAISTAFGLNDFSNSSLTFNYYNGIILQSEKLSPVKPSVVTHSALQSEDVCTVFPTKARMAVPLSNYNLDLNKPEAFNDELEDEDDFSGSTKLEEILKTSDLKIDDLANNAISEGECSVIKFIDDLLFAHVSYSEKVIGDLIDFSLFSSNPTLVEKGIVLLNCYRHEKIAKNYVHSSIKIKELENSLKKVQKRIS
ncbi:MAG: hypothetical protein LKJ88_03265 [Bacilli bacterium]|jgi:hypothetical protein|nr:hypothetical protein [Bacilli bacterium]